jgi:hypothetical protein
MKNKTILFALIATGLTHFFSSCNDKPIEPSTTTGNITIEFDHRWGMNEVPFQYQSAMLHPMSGDSLTTNLLKYYISNIVLIKKDGSAFTVPNSYYLIDPTNNEIEIKDIPSGEYSQITYTVGVDSTANCSGAQEGALNPSNGMFWSWNSGYIFVRIEGKSNKSKDGNFLYHIGGYKGQYNAIRVNSASFGSGVLNIAPNAKPTIHMVTNVAKLWHGPIYTSNLSMLHMIGSDASTLATNFASGIRFDHIHP